MDWRELVGYQTFSHLVEAPQSFPFGVVTCGFCGTSGQFNVANAIQRAGSTYGHTDASSLTLVCRVCANVTFLIYGNRKFFGNVVDFAQFPKSAGKFTAEDSWPPAAGRFFVQAQESLRTQSWDAATVMARSAVQVIVRDKGGVGRTLAAETADLVEKGLLVNSMAEWAKEIREEGNDSAHPKTDSAGATEKSAREIVQFTQHLLIYLYTIPSQIDQRREEAK